MNKLLSIQEVANILGVSGKTLRRWEEKGILVPHRTPGNQRRYTQDQIDNFRKQKTGLPKISSFQFSKTIPSRSLSQLSIQEVANILGVSGKTLRRWEEKGILVPLRTRGNQRRYMRDQIDNFRQQKGFLPRTTMPDSSERGSNGDMRSEVPNAPIIRSWVRGLPQVQDSESQFQTASQLISQPLEAKEVESTQYWAEELVRSILVFKKLAVSAVFIMLFVAVSGVAIATLKSANLLNPAGLPKILSVLGISKNKLQEPELLEVLRGKAVLGAGITADNLVFGVNVASEFAQNAQFLDTIRVAGIATLSGGVVTENADIDAGTGSLTASNVLYGAIGGAGITVGPGQTPIITNTGVLSLTAGSGISVGTGSKPTVSNTGVLSLGGSTGSLTLAAGTGISVSGLSISTSGGVDLLSASCVTASGGIVTGSGVCGSSTGPWFEGAGILYPTNSTVDLLVGGQTTASAKFAVLNVNSGTPTATIAGNLIVMPYTSGASELGGNVGIGTTAPGAKLDIQAPSLTNGIGLNITSTSPVTDTADPNFLYRLFSADQTAQYTDGDNTSATLFSLTRNVGAGTGAIIPISQDPMVPPETSETHIASTDVGATLTWSHTISSLGTGSHLLLVGVTQIFGNSASTTVTYNGDSLTSLGSVTSTGNCPTICRLQVFYKVNPDSGTHNVVVTPPSGSASLVIIAGSTSWYNVNTTTPLGSLATSTGHSPRPTVDVSGAGEQVVHDFVSFFPLNTNLSGPGSIEQTEQWLKEVNIVFTSSSLGGSTARNVNEMSWQSNNNDSNNWMMAAVPINPLNSGGTETVNVSGALARIEAICGQGGICNDSSNVLYLNQSNPNSTGAVLNISNSGLGSMLNVSGFSSGKAAAVINQASTTQDIFTASTSGVTKFVITNAGKVGIGTTTPNANLAIGNNVATGFLNTYAEYQMILYDGATAGGSYGLGIKGNTMVFNSGAGAYSFDRAGNATTMTMDTSGNVGIGTTAPNSLLQVAGTASVAGAFTIYTTPTIQSAAFKTLTIGSTTTGDISFTPKNIQSLYLSGIGGRVGVGTMTAPKGLLDISGDAGNNATLILNNTDTNTSDLFTASSSGTTRFTVNNAGDLVLGTTTRLTNLGVGTFITGTVIGSQTFTTNNIADSGALTIASGGGAGLTLNSASNTITFNSTDTTLTASGLATITSAATLGISATTLNLGGGAAATIGTVSNDDLTLSPNGTGNIVLTGDFDSQVLIGATSATTEFPLFINNSIGSNASLAINNINEADLFTASASGLTKFTISNTGVLTDAAYTNAGGILYTATTGIIGQTAVGTGSQCLLGGTVPSFGSCGSGEGADIFWNQASGLLYPNNSTVDFAIGGQASTSAKFAVLNINSGTPTASISAGLGDNNAAFLTGLGVLGTTNRQTLTLGGDDTGDINLSLAGSSNLRISGTAGVTVSGTCVNSLNGIVTGSVTCIGAGSTNWDVINGAITPKLTSTLDFLLGSQASSSAKFAVLNIAGSLTPIASISATTASGGSGTGLVLSGNGSIQSLLNANLTLGGDKTGGINFTPGNIQTAFLSSIGRVGIGTQTNPKGLLDITGNAGNNATLILNNTDTNTSDIFTASSSGTTRFVITNSGGLGINTGANNSTLLSTLDVRPNLTNGGTLSIASVSGATSFAGLLVDNTGVGDLFTASKSGATKFTILNNGNLQITGTTNFLTTLTSAATAARTIAFPDVSGTICVSGSTCAAPSSGVAGYWNLTAGALFPDSSTVDLLVGGTTTASAKFAVLNINSGTPTATVAGNLIVMPYTSGASELGGNVGIGTTAPNQLLHLSSGASPAMQFTSATSDTSSGPKDGSTFANDSTVGTVDWTNPSFAQSHDASYATIPPSGSSWTSKYLKATGFGFNIPGGAVINGIRVEVEENGALTNDNSIKIVQGGTIAGSEKSTGAAWPGSDAYSSYGSSSDLWGLSWTAGNINASNFGVGISAQCTAGPFCIVSSTQINHIRITVYYTHNNNWIAGIDTSAAGGFQLSHSTAFGTSDYLTIDTAGRVGLGTTAPISELHVTRPLSFGATGKALAIFNQIENQDIFTASASGTTKFVIAKNGNIGIGMTVPKAKLTVGGDYLNTGYGGILLDADPITFPDTWTLGINPYLVDFLQAGFSFRTKAFGGTTRDNLTLFDTGQVAIANTIKNSAQLHVTRPLSFGATGKALAIFDQIENQDIFTASVSGTTKLTITKKGFIDIIDGFNSTGVGYQALKANTTGTENTALGYQALTANTTGTENTAVGYRALFSNVGAGNDNTALGYLALYSNTTGDSNTAIGVQTLNANITGSNNTAVGYQALVNNLSNNNTAVGYQALNSNATGSNNTAMGWEALFNNDTGASNIALGYTTLSTNASGSFNIALGNLALFSNLSGSNNTALGYQAGYGAPGDGLYANSTASNNTFLGYNSSAFSATQRNNMTAIGAFSVVDQANSLVLGGLGFYAVNVGIGTATPSAVLDIQGGNRGGRAALIVNQTGAVTNDIFTASASGTTRFVITNAGNVGIGTADPKANLHVSSNTSGLAPMFQFQGVFPQFPTVLQEVSGSVTSDATVIIGLNLENSSVTANTYSPFITFSRKSNSTSYNPTFAAIGGQYTGNGPDTNWASGALTFMTGATATTYGPVERMRINSSGNVGIGTTAPLFGLDVRNSQAATAAAQIFNTSTNADADGLILKLGNASTTVVSATNHFISFETSGIGIVGSVQGNGAKGLTYAQSGIADFAEYFKKDENQNIEYGSVVCIDIKGLVLPCDSNNTRVVGVASEHPAFLGGEDLGSKSIAVGLVGLIYTRVSTESGAILPGDPLTQSSNPGVAVKATRAGSIIGRALEEFNGTEGKILVSVNLGWYDPQVYLGADGNLSYPKSSEAAALALGLPGVPAINQPISQSTNQQITNSTSSASFDLASDANFIDLKNRVGSVEAQIEDLRSQIINSSTQSAFLSSIASEPAVLGASDSAEFISTLKNATIEGDLNVLGRTTITDLGVTGNIATGLLSIHGLDSELNNGNGGASINSVGDLNLQNNGLGGINILAGKVTIDTEGNIKTAGGITARKINIDTTNQDARSLGSGVIGAGETSVEISTTAVTGRSRILVTPTTKTGNRALVVSNKSAGNGFTITIEGTYTQDIKFDWWIVDEK